MLIIFDLDDTLIDTSGCITPKKLENAFHKMVLAGLNVKDATKSLEILHRLDESASSAKEALSEFLEINGAKPGLMEIALAEVYDTDSDGVAVFPLNGALELLAELKEKHLLAMVTVGKRDLQLEKMKKAGIEPALFSKIIASEDRNKKPHYAALMEELGIAPPDILVCGDKVHIDLKPARELGFTTVHMRWGRGRRAIGEMSDVDYTISSITEIKEILNKINT